MVTSGWHPDNVEEADRELLAHHVWGEPDKDRWLTVQVAALHGYLVDPSEPDVLDQADEISALIPAIVTQRHQDGDTVPAPEDRRPARAPRLGGAAQRNSEPARASRVAAARAAGLRPARSPASGRGRPRRTPALEHPQHCWLTRGWHPLDNGIVARTLRLINNPHRARSAPQ